MALTDADVMQILAQLTTAAIQHSKEFDVERKQDRQGVIAFMDEIYAKLVELNQKAKP